MIGSLNDWAADRGFRVAVGPGKVLQDVRAELKRRVEALELDPGFYGANLGSFRYEESSDTIRDVKSVVLVAVPRPAHRVTFYLTSGPYDVVLPPTYVRYRSTFDTVRNDIVTALPELRGHLDTLVAPLKAIAARLGLVQYGRNNLTYIPEWGSYFQLVGYVTDLELGFGGDWGSEEPQLMPECEGCGMCEAVCCTGAIGDRMLLHAEHCTTLFSEAPGNLQADLSPGCLFGCLECQESCPMNAGLLRIEPAAVVFTPEETDALIKEQPGTGAAVQSALEKLNILGLTEAPLVGRNLRYLLSGKSPRA